MQIIKSTLFLFSFIFLLASCKSDTNQTASASDNTAQSNNPASAAAATSSAINNHSEVASELCKCMQPLIDLNKKIQRLVKEGNTEAVQNMIGEVEKLSDEGEACTERLEAKYGKITGGDEEKIEKAMRKSCPDVARMISAANRQEAK